MYSEWPPLYPKSLVTGTANNLCIVREAGEAQDALELAGEGGHLQGAPFVPFAFVLPSLARPNVFSIAPSNLATGLISTMTCAFSSPAFHQSSAVLGGTCSRSPTGAMIPLPLQPEADPPLQHREPLKDGRVHVLPGHGPAGPHEGLCHQKLAARVLCTDADHNPLVGNRVLRDVPGPRHSAFPVHAYHRAGRAKYRRTAHPANGRFCAPSEPTPRGPRPQKTCKLTADP